LLSPQDGKEVTFTPEKGFKEKKLSDDMAEKIAQVVLGADAETALSWAKTQTDHSAWIQYFATGRTLPLLLRLTRE